MCRSGDLARDKHVQIGHDVANLAADGRLDFLGSQRLSPEASADGDLVAQHGDLFKGAAATSDRLLSAEPAALADHQDGRSRWVGAVPPCRPAPTSRR